jgi:uncharacterized membrane protein YccC
MLFAGALSYPLRASLPILVRGVLADFLWSAAFACALMAITRSPRWATFGFVVAELLELAQLHPSVPGTFDAGDLVAIAIGWALGLLVEMVTRHPRDAARDSRAEMRPS